MKCDRQIIDHKSINFLLKYKMNYINYYIIKTAVKLKDYTT